MDEIVKDFVDAVQEDGSQENVSYTEHFLLGSETNACGALVKKLFPDASTSGAASKEEPCR